MRKLLASVLALCSTSVFGRDVSNFDPTSFEDCVSKQKASVGYKTTWKKKRSLKEERIRAKGSIEVGSLVEVDNRLLEAPSPFTDGSRFSGIYIGVFDFSSHTKAKKEVRPCVKVPFSGKKCSSWVKYDNPWGSNHPTGTIKVEVGSNINGGASLVFTYSGRTNADNRPNNFVKNFLVPVLKGKVKQCAIDHVAKDITEDQIDGWF